MRTWPEMTQTVRCNACNAKVKSPYASDLVDFIEAHQHALVTERPEAKP